MKFLKKMLFYAPLLSAVFVLACVGIVLGSYTAPVYEMQADAAEDETEVEAVKTEESENTEDIMQKKSGSFDLEDGKYIGRGMGFAGEIKVAVEIEKQTIKGIDVLSAKADDAAYVHKAKGVIEKVILKQSTDVDVVSGATYSSKGILAAIKNALTGEMDNCKAQSQTAALGSKTLSTVKDADIYKDGIYYGAGVGFSGEISVKVEIIEGRIATIALEKTMDDESYIQKASSVMSQIVSTQSTNVDTVSGATYSSVGIIEAVRDALAQAAGEEEDEEEDLSGRFPYKEGIYQGIGKGFLGDIKTAVVIQDETIKAILVLESADDEAFMEKAEKVAKDVVEKQSIEVDTVSGATYSSKGILKAIKKALKEAEKVTEGKKNTSDDDENEDNENTENPDTAAPQDTENTDVTTPENTENPDTTAPEDSENTTNPDTTVTETTENTQTPETTEDTAGGYRDGEYKVSVTCEPDSSKQFKAYTLTLKITVSDGKITKITDITGDGGSGNVLFINLAANGTAKKPGVVTQIVENGMPENIDAVSGATCSSKSIVEACIQALEQAKE